MSTREAWSTATTEQMHRLRGKGRQETTAAGDHLREVGSVQQG